MAELSVFCDESGEATDPDIPFYLITLVFHEQSLDVHQAMGRYEQQLRLKALPDVPFHARPLRMGNEPYAYLSETERHQLLVSFAAFVKKLPITYRTFSCSKAGPMSPKAIEHGLWRQLTTFLIDHLVYFQSFDRVQIYYDGGQKLVTRVLHQSFEAVIAEGALLWQHPKYGEYRLLQVADYLCDLERAELRYNQGKRISGTTNAFYGAHSYFRSHFYKQAKRKRLE